MINCKGCLRPIYEGDKVLIIQFYNDLPEMFIHKKFDCLLMLEEINEGIGSFDKYDLTEG